MRLAQVHQLFEEQVDLVRVTCPPEIDPSEPLDAQAEVTRLEVVHDQGDAHGRITFGDLVQGDPPQLRVRDRGQSSHHGPLHLRVSIGHPSKEPAVEARDTGL
ncbi:hypothetical protein [Roseateles depolymerans]|uniref:hypothetical protein n=1 Tax=Roseateles depolymerans TaxID=76731 RepID=UPI0014756888|nr:hypothetical protein [Roseateles depolymerans]